MMLNDLLLPCAAVHVGVDLCGCYVLVAEHLLDNPQVGPMLYQMRGERMPECMWGYLFHDTCGKSVFLHDLEQ